MFKAIKKQTSRIMAAVLSLIMILSLIPVGAFITAWAAPIEAYTVTLTDGTDTLTNLDGVNITLTNKSDAEKTDTVATVAGVATFSDFVEEDATYTVTVASVLGYADVASAEHTVAASETNKNITVTALEKVTLSGIVTDETDAAYEGAAVKVTGYFETETTTNAEGKYSVEVYKDKDVAIEIAAKAEDPQYVIGNVATAKYSANTTKDHKFAIKTFNVTTTADAGGTITATDTVEYGAAKNVVITANDGYRIDTVTINGEAKSDFRGKTTHTVELTDIKDNQTVDVTFFRMTYKVNFTVGTNGEVKYGEGETDKVAGGSVNVEKLFEESTDSANPTKVTVTATPNPTFRVSKVVIDGGEAETFYENNKSYETVLTMTTNHTFVVEFVINEYALNVDTPEHGTVSADRTTAIKHGETVNVTAKPENGYELTEIKVAGTAVPFVENADGSYTAKDVTINDDSDVTATFVQKVELPEGSYELTLPTTTGTVDGVTYVAKGNEVTFEATAPYTRVRINGKSNLTGASVTITVGDGDGQVANITSIEVSNAAVADWTKAKELNITFDETKPVIGDIENSGDTWFKDSATYSFTATDDHSGVKEVKYSSTNNIEGATTISKADDKYSFTVNTEYEGKYYVWVIDNCGNIQTKEATVKVDTKAPSITGFSFSTAADSDVDDLINYLSFGIFCKQTVYVTVTAEDERISSGLNQITLNYGDGESKTETVKDGKAMFELTEAEFDSGKNISATASDVAGKVSESKAPADFGISSNNVKINAGETEIEFGYATPQYNPNASTLWFKDDTTFTVKVSDEEVGIYSVLIKLNGEEILNKADYLNEASATLNDEFVFNTADLSSAKEGQNVIDVVVVNNARVEKTNSDDVLYLDRDTPVVTAFDFNEVNGGPLSKVFNFLTFGIFFNNNVEVTVTVKDPAEASGANKITLYCDGTAYDPIEAVEDKATFELPMDDFKTLKTVSASVNDKVGHESEVLFADTMNTTAGLTDYLMLENEAPVLSEITEENVSNVNKHENIYSGNIDISFTAKDEDSGLRSVELALFDSNIDEYVANYLQENEGSSVAAALFSIKSENLTSVVAKPELYANDTAINDYNYTGNTANMETLEDGSYNFVLRVVDNAGNVSAKYLRIREDTTAPVITKFDFKVAGGSKENEAVIVDHYGFYFKEKVTVEITAEDMRTPYETAAGVKKIVYKAVDIHDGIIISDADDAINNKVSFDIPANFKGQIYAYAIDNLDNNPIDNKVAPNYSYAGFITDTTDGNYGYAYPSGAIVEDAIKHSETSSIDIKAQNTSYAQNNDYSYAYDSDIENIQLDSVKAYDDDVLVPLYANNPTFNVEVNDSYSGIRNVTVKVIENGNVAVIDSLNIANNDVDLEDWIEKDDTRDNNLVTSISKSFNFAEVYPNGNYNDMVLLVELTDRAGNSSYDYYVFGIDKTIPTIDVKYDNNTPDAQYTDFYKANRTATITITERNFRAKDVVFKITNTDKVIPGVDLTKDATWTKTPNENPDLTTYTAKIPYTADGDYTFNIAYKDNAQNTATSYADKFTLDKTIPTVDVAYDNNSAANGNYYKADRVATITINEHNFDAARVNVIGTATDNGTPIAFPVTSGWTSNGDVHTATIHYSADAKYSFDIEFNDKAGNSIADYTPVEFYVDKTLPVLSIADIVDKSANNTKENIGFTITATDTNFNGFAPVLTAVIKEADNSFTVKNITVGKMSDIENGARYVVTNLDTDGIYSITCTFVDKAGNAFNQVILEDAKGGTYTEKRSGSDTLLQFSVNRDGSTFMLNDFTSKLLKNYYVKKVGSDVKIIEINADKITANTVTLNGKKLTENTDYKVTHEFSTGGWHKYTYTIDKSLFEAEGEYNIVVSSKDAATNDAFSDVKGVSAKFVVDRTAPVITVTGMVTDGIYKTDKQKVTIVPTDDGGALKSLIVRLVDEDGKVMKVLVDLEGDELIKALDENSGKIEFTINKGMYQNIQIICDDYSVGEGDKENNVYNKTFENVTVDSNAFIVFWADKTLRWSVIGGTALLLAGIVALVIFLKKKKAK